MNEVTFHGSQSEAVAEPSREPEFSFPLWYSREGMLLLLTGFGMQNRELSGAKAGWFACEDSLKYVHLFHCGT